VAIDGNHTALVVEFIGLQFIEHTIRKPACTPFSTLRFPRLPA
jgi:hypothetical protein